MSSGQCPFKIQPQLTAIIDNVILLQYLFGYLVEEGTANS